MMENDPANKLLQHKTYTDLEKDWGVWVKLALRGEKKPISNMQEKRTSHFSHQASSRYKPDGVVHPQIR